jgi:hypothetical protein
MQMQDYSRTSLLEFLDYLGDKGLQNKNTVASSKGAANSMLSILDDTEATDLRQVDLDVVATRFANLKGSKYPPTTLQVYRARTGKAIQDFLRYKDNPVSFRIGSGSPKSKSSGPEAKTKTKPQGTGIDRDDRQRTDNLPDRAVILTVPVALRPGCIMQLSGVPADLSHAEATKISNIVLAMAMPEKK